MRWIARQRRVRTGPLAVAGILATPLFFVALMAFSLALDDPTVKTAGGGAEELGDPTRATVALIYLLSAAVSAGIVLVGVVSLFLPGRIGVYVPALVTIPVTLALLLPLDTWEAEHTARYPLGVDLIPADDPGDLILRGEWEENAQRAARQIGFLTIAMAIAAIVVAAGLAARRRRRPAPPRVPPPPEVATGQPAIGGSTSIPESGPRT